MWRGVVTWLALGCLGAPELARAGTLKEVIQGLNQAAGVSPSGGGSAPSSGTSVLGAVVDGLLHADWSGGGGDGPTYVPPLYATPTGGAPDVSVYVGAQSVSGSNGSATMEVIARHRDFGLALRGTSFFESPENPGDPSLRLDVGTLAGLVRVYGDVAWLELGGAWVNTVDGASVFGMFAGLRLDRRLGGELSAGALARYAVLTDSVRYLELQAGLRLSILNVSYRYLEFNVGPPLHGPEIGLSLSF